MTKTATLILTTLLLGLPVMAQADEASSPDKSGFSLQEQFSRISRLVKSVAPGQSERSLFDSRQGNTPRGFGNNLNADRRKPRTVVCSNDASPRPVVTNSFATGTQNALSETRRCVGVGYFLSF